jgi:6-phosphofructokinase 2
VRTSTLRKKKERDSMTSILTVTLNPAVDRTTRVDRVEPDRKLRCESPLIEPGGGGLNVSRAIAKLGGSSRAVWACGGPPGRILADLLDAEGIEHEPVEINAHTRQNLIVREESSGRQFRFGMPGAELTADEAERFIERIGQSDAEYIVASGSLPPGLDDDFYARLSSAADRSKRFVLDTSGAPLIRAHSGNVWLVKPNVRELCDLTGCQLDDDRAVEDAARGLIADHGVAVVVVSLGAGGAMVVTETECHHIPSPTVPIRSKVGAGDSMVAGIVLALERGRSFREATRFGVAAGAAAVMTPGTELCRREDAERLDARMAERAGDAAPG